MVCFWKKRPPTILILFLNVRKQYLEKLTFTNLSKSQLLSIMIQFVHHLRKFFLKGEKK